MTSIHTITQFSPHYNFHTRFAGAHGEKWWNFIATIIQFPFATASHGVIELFDALCYFNRMISFSFKHFLRCEKKIYLCKKNLHKNNSSSMNAFMQSNFGSCSSWHAFLAAVLCHFVHTIVRLKPRHHVNMFKKKIKRQNLPFVGMCKLHLKVV